MCVLNFRRSTGILTVKPGSTNTVPGFVQFSLDMRCRQDATLLKLEEALKRDFAQIASGEDVEGLNAKGTKGRGCTVDWKLDTVSPATKFHGDCIQCVEDSAKDMLGTNCGAQLQRMTSGAGHDRYAQFAVPRESAVNTFLASTFLDVFRRP